MTTPTPSGSVSPEPTKGERARRLALIQARANDPRRYDNARGDVMFLLDEIARLNRTDERILVGFDWPLTSRVPEHPIQWCPCCSSCWKLGVQIHVGSHNDWATYLCEGSHAMPTIEPASAPTPTQSLNPDLVRGRQS